MVFETTVQDRTPLSQVGHGMIKTLVILGVGVTIGVLAAERGLNLPASGTVLQTGEIIGEDWHGNVRRSSRAE